MMDISTADHYARTVELLPIRNQLWDGPDGPTGELPDPAMSRLDEWSPVIPHQAARQGAYGSPAERRRRFVVLPGGRARS